MLGMFTLTAAASTVCLWLAVNGLLSSWSPGIVSALFGACLFNALVSIQMAIPNK